MFCKCVYIANRGQRLPRAKQCITFPPFVSSRLPCLCLPLPLRTRRCTGTSSCEARFLSFKRPPQEKSVSPTTAMANKKKPWGNRSSWAMRFFDVISPASPPSPVAPVETMENPARTSASPLVIEPVVFQNDKHRKRTLNDPQTCYRCRRCHAVLHPPIDKATGKPRYGVMLCEHLEGISSGGTTHLATGVTVCTAGILQYVPELVDRSIKYPIGSATSTVEMEHVSTERNRKRTSQSGRCNGKSEAKTDNAAPARVAVTHLLRKCQQVALSDCGSVAGRSPVPLLFVVVENPKTPANAGGILRAMRCYGVRGPSAKSNTTTLDDPAHYAMQTASVTMPEERVTENASILLPQVTDASEGVLKRVGAFIFSGTRLQKALAHTDFVSTLRTDPTHAARDIPQLCLPSLDVLFDVLREEFGHHSVSSSSSSVCSPSLVRVVAVELVEGATLLPAYEHPFNYGGEPTHPSTRAISQAGCEEIKSAFASVVAAVPMVFYVFGAEDGTLSEHHIKHDVDDVVFMPTTGSMNLAATVNVLLYDRVAKERCGLKPAATDVPTTDTAPLAGGEEERERGRKWRDVFESRNANNRTRWTRPN